MVDLKLYLSSLIHMTLVVVVYMAVNMSHVSCNKNNQMCSPCPIAVILSEGNVSGSNIIYSG